MLKIRLVLLTTVLALVCPELAGAADHLIPPSVNPSMSLETQRRIVEEGRAEFEKHIEEIRALGVPNDRVVLEYLAFELFYNVPNREIVARRNEIKMNTVKLTYVGEVNKNFKKDFPGLKADGAHHDIYLKGIKITGHEGWFVWDDNNRFIVKSSFEDEGYKLSSFFETVLPQSKDLTLDYVKEYSVQFGSQEEGIMRPFKTFRGAHKYIYPLHGVLGSYKIHELALTHGMSTLEYLEKRLIPLLADQVFETMFILGIYHASHTQNEWLVLDEKGNEHLAIKDLNGALRDYGAASPQFHKAHGFMNSKGLHNEAYISFSEDNPKAMDPAFAFASYTVQSMLMGMTFTIKEEARLFASFFNRFIYRIENEFQTKIQWSENTKNILDALKDVSHEYDLKSSVPTRQSFSKKYTGFQALSFTLLSEILPQIYKLRMGKTFEPQDKETREFLEKKWADKETWYYLSPIYPSPMKTSAEFKSERRWSYWYERYNSWTENKRQAVADSILAKAQLQFNKNHIAKVDPKTGNILAVVPLDTSEQKTFCASKINAILGNK